MTAYRISDAAVVVAWKYAPRESFSLTGLQFFDDGIERLFPADTHKLRVDAETFLRVGSLERIVHPVRIIKQMGARKTLYTDFAAPCRSIRVPLNLRHNTVLPMDSDPAHTVALTATSGDPDILLNFGRLCNSHLTVLSLNYKTKVEILKREAIRRRPTCSANFSCRDYKGVDGRRQ